jgi:hypothetical protein
LIRPELSTSSTADDELFPKQPTNKIVQKKRGKKRIRKDIFLPKRNIESDNYCQKKDDSNGSKKCYEEGLAHPDNTAKPKCHRK